MKGERDGAGGTLKGGSGGRAVETGNWSVAKATLLSCSGETLDGPVNDSGAAARVRRPAPAPRAPP